MGKLIVAGAPGGESILIVSCRKNKWLCWQKYLLGEKTQAWLYFLQRNFGTFMLFSASTLSRSVLFCRNEAEFSGLWGFLVNVRQIHTVRACIAHNLYICSLLRICVMRSERAEQTFTVPQQWGENNIYVFAYGEMQRRRLLTASAEMLMCFNSTGCKMSHSCWKLAADIIRHILTILLNCQTLNTQF